MIKTDEEVLNEFDDKFAHKCLGETIGHDEVYQNQLKFFIKKIRQKDIEEISKMIIENHNNEKLNSIIINQLRNK